jgi:hypothetical protein
MDLSIEEILRRLLLLGLPLVPLGCSDGKGSLRGSPDAMSFDGGAVGQGGSSGAGAPGGGGAAGDDRGGRCGNVPFEATKTVARAQSPSSWTWDECAADPRDCSAVCAEQAPFHGSISITTCERIDETDAGVDAAGDSGIVDLVEVRDATLESGTTREPSLTVHVEGIIFPCTGRRPASLERLSFPSRGTAAGRWLAAAAALEAASVPAFQRLARELVAHGAPARLVEAARGAAVEEARHYALMAQAARARGAEPERPAVRPMAIRPLLEVARENAREGCVRETFGAMTAMIQSRQIPDQKLRATLASIARDETRHARLAWEVDVWARAALSEREAREVDAARRSEGATLVREVGGVKTSFSASRELGLPADGVARRLANRAQRALWKA